MIRARTMLGLLLVVGMMGFVAITAFAEVPQQFLPGREIQVKDQIVGPARYYVVYVPGDYAPERSWPAIFCYHGRGGGPTTFPYKDFTDGKGFVLVGMDYFWDSMNVHSEIGQDVQNIKRLVPQLVKQLNLDPNQLFIAGNSAGGFAASGIAEATPSFWAGVMILGAGRYENLHKRPTTLPSVGSSFPIQGFGVATPKRPKDANSFAGRSVYLGAGEQDENLWWAEKARDYYQSIGAEVTFEAYKGVGHGTYPATKTIKDWLYSNGPVKQVESGMGEASAAQNAGELGRAYLIFKAIASLTGGNEKLAEILGQAAKAAGQLANDAEGKIGAAEIAAADGRYEEALKALSQVSKSYKGSEFGERAGKAFVLIQRNPAIREARELAKKQSELNAQALVLEKKAQGAEKTKDYLTALKLYEQYLTSFTNADRYEAVKAHLESLKADPKVQAILHEQEADRDCLGWLKEADKLVTESKNDEARQQLQKILDKYGDTDWAGKAKERLKKLS